jgi:hypothetical protein
MWVIHFILLLILGVAIVMFVVLNGGRFVELISLGFGDYENVSLNLIVLESFLIGALWALVVFFFIQLATRIKMMRLKKTNRKLQDELDSLRTLPLEDLPIPEDEK